MANQPKKYKKFVATAATATLVASAIVPVASAASFSDVPENSEFAPFIDALTEAGIIKGYSESNTFKPGAALTRGQVVKMLGRWVENNGVDVPTDWNTKARFKDVPTNHKDQELVKYAALVADKGVFGGADGKLMAGNNITRQQMAKVLNGAYAAVNDQSLIEIAEGMDNVLIPDLSNARAEYEDAIQALMNLEISSTTSGNFRPLENVTRAQFSKFLYNTIEFEAVDVAPFEIKVVNNTTVEVIFEEEIEDIKAIDFAIEGLKVENAVVKQTSKRTAVLTTESQKGGTEYTVTVDGEKAGSFTGIAAVVPTAVKIVNQSTQGVTGKEVTVQAQVTVAEGQSKAGIPVTFYVAGSADGLKQAITKEATTNDDGIATYTYTQYVAGDDSVTAYATGDRSKFSNGTVHWGVATQLVIEEVTTDATIKNGANKTYKIKAVNPTTGAAEVGKSFNIAFEENIGVTADKLTTATVNGVNPRQVANIPTLAANVVTDSKGEAVFTVTGTNAKATPVVYEAAIPATAPSTVVNVPYTATALQVKAPTVTFAALQVEHVITIKGELTKDHTAGDGNAREFTVSVVDKAGKPVANEVIKLAVNELVDNVLGTTSSARFVEFDAAGNAIPQSTGLVSGNPYTVVTNAKGEATFYLGAPNNLSASLTHHLGTPVAWIDINDSNAYTNNVLEASEPFSIGETTYFWAEQQVGAKLVVKNNTTNREVSSLASNVVARYEFKLTNQSGNAVSSASTFVSSINARYNVSNVGPATVAAFNSSAALGTYTTYATAGTRTQAQLRAEVERLGGTVITANRTEYVDVNGPVANEIFVVSLEPTKNADVSVTASATATRTSTYGGGTTTLTTAEAKAVKLVASNVVGAVVTGAVASYNTDDRTITIAGKDPVKYAGDTDITNYVFKGYGGSSIADAASFLRLVARNGAEVTITTSGDTRTFEIVALGVMPLPTNEVAAGAAEPVQDLIDALAADGTDDTTDVLAATTAYNALSAEEKAYVDETNLEAAVDAELSELRTLTSTDYTTTTWTAYSTVLAANAAVSTDTFTEKVTKLTALNAAVANLVEAVTVSADTTTGIAATGLGTIDITFAEAVSTDALTTFTVGTVNLGAANSTTAVASNNSGTLKVTISGTVANGDIVTIPVTINGVTGTLTLTATVASGTATWAVTPTVLR